MNTDLFDRYAVVDVDTHITEPADVWTSRLPASWGDKIPHIERVDGKDTWFAAGQRIGSPGITAMAGFDGTVPESPLTYDDVPPAAFDPKARLAQMDELGIHAQVLYPNIGGFGNGYFLKYGERELALACVQAYNDFQTEFASADPNRLLPVTSIPFWDVEAAVREIERCAEAGHRAINFCNQPDVYDQPVLTSRHWDPIWATARDTGLPISFHIGGGDIAKAIMNDHGMGWKTNFARVSAMLFMDNLRCIADLTIGGVCARFPEVNFVSVESGVGWVPSALEALDWQFLNGGVRTEHPDRLLPSEYFRRQVYATFWFERESALFAIERYPDNVLYETDYPHPTCQHPGPATPAQYPRDYANEVLGRLPEDTARKVLSTTAARLYRVTV